MKNTVSILIAATMLFAFKPVNNSNWTVDKSHAKLGFSVSHLMLSESEGVFKTYDIKFTSSKEDFTDAVIELTADVNSISTEDEKRDVHLKNPDFFDAAKFPSLIFKSTSLKKIEGKKYQLNGNLTIRGTTKFVQLDVIANTGTNPFTKKPATGFKVTGTINRSDFGVGANYPAAVVGNEVTITANMEFGLN